MSRQPLVLLLALLLTASAACRAQPAAPPSAAAADVEVYSYRTPSRDGIGKVSMGREIAQVMGYQRLSWLERPERPERQSTEMPDQVVDAPDSSPVMAESSVRVVSRR